MKSRRVTYLTIRRRLMARASALVLRVALRPRGWASGVLMVGLVGAPAAALAQATVLSTDAELILRGGPAGDQSGFSVSGAGDVNGDGIDDLIIGARNASPKGRTNAGTTYVVFGTDRGFPRIINLAARADVVIQGAAAYDSSGSSVSGAGDVNGDGVDDLIIGAPGADPNGREGAGAGYVVFGTHRGLPATLDLASDAGLIIQGVAPDKGFAARAVSGAGDVNGDGIDDLIIGAAYADPGGREDAGASYVVFGGPAAALERLIVDVEAADLPLRLENRLTRYLENALNGVTKDRINLAIFRLRAFVLRVEAQRGNKIDEADADDWIADAEAIIDTLKAQRQRDREAPQPALSSLAGVT